MKRPSISVDEARRRLSYCRATGEFTWLVTMSCRAPAGSRAGTLMRNGYRAVAFNGVQFYEHRVAVWLETGVWPETPIDHKNGCKADNRWSNLRPCTPSQNAANAKRQSNNKSGVRGVHWDRRSGKWKAVITKNKREHWIGLFGDLAEAKEAYVARSAALFGEFARHA